MDLGRQMSHMVPRHGGGSTDPGATAWRGAPSENQLTHTVISGTMCPRNEHHNENLMEDLRLKRSLEGWRGIRLTEQRGPTREEGDRGVQCSIHLEIVDSAEHLNEPWLNKYQKYTDLVMLPQFNVCKLFNFSRKELTHMSSLEAHVQWVLKHSALRMCQKPRWMLQVCYFQSPQQIGWDILSYVTEKDM